MKKIKGWLELHKAPYQMWNLHRVVDISSFRRIIRMQVTLDYLDRKSITRWCKAFMEPIVIPGNSYQTANNIDFFTSYMLGCIFNNASSLVKTRDKDHLCAK